MIILFEIAVDCQIYTTVSILQQNVVFIYNISQNIIHQNSNISTQKCFIFVLFILTCHKRFVSIIKQLK